MEFEVDRIIISAMNEAGLLSQTYLGSEHLLLAILKNDKLQITQVLNKYGVNYQKVRMDILDLNYTCGLLSYQNGYSHTVMEVISKCDSSSSIILELLMLKDNLAHSLLERYAIPVEKLLN